MDVDKFMSLYAAYYGIDVVTNAIKITMIRDYVASITDEQRKLILTKLMCEFIPTSTVQYPIISHMRSYLNTPANVEAAALSAWNDLCKKANRYRSITITDSKVIYALDMIGGWFAFCDRSCEAEVFMRKDFIKAYKQAKESGAMIEPKIYHGELTDSDDKMLFIGVEVESIGCDTKKYSEIAKKISVGLDR